MPPRPFPSPDQPEITEEILIVGEGAGDAALVKYLCEDRGIQGFQIEDSGSSSKFQAYIKGLPGRKSVQKLKLLVVVADCDDAPDASFDQIRKQMRQAGIPYPANSFQLAQRTNNTSFATYVIMLPFQEAKHQRGALETLLLPAALQHLAQHVECLEAWATCADIARLSSSHRDKAKLRTLLVAAIPGDPNLGLQWALSPSRKLIPLNHACFDPLADLLRSLPGMV